jgi:hypothetical protein
MFINVNTPCLLNNYTKIYQSGYSWFIKCLHYVHHVDTALLLSDYAKIINSNTALLLNNYSNLSKCLRLVYQMTTLGFIQLILLYIKFITLRLLM